MLACEPERDDDVLQAEVRQQWSGKKNLSIVGHACDVVSPPVSSSPELEDEEDNNGVDGGLALVGLSEAGFEMVGGNVCESVGGGRTLFLRTTQGCSHSCEVSQRLCCTSLLLCLEMEREDMERARLAWSPRPDIEGH